MILVACGKDAHDVLHASRKLVQDDVVVFVGPDVLHGPVVLRGSAVHSSGRKSQSWRQILRHVVALVLEQQISEKLHRLELPLSHSADQCICFLSLYCIYSTFLNGPTQASFIIYFQSFQTDIIAIFTTNICEKMFIQYMVLGFEPTTFGT